MPVALCERRSLERAVGRHGLLIREARFAGHSGVNMIQTPRQERMLFGDEADAHAFWKDKEWKTFAVDLIAHTGRKQKVIHTMYVRARTSADAAQCAKDNDWTRKPKPRYVARLAGPRELGCTPSPKSVNVQG